MATYDRLPQYHSKKPDHFISFFDRLYHKVYENGLKITIILSIIILVGIGVLFWRGVHQNQIEEATTALFQAGQKGEKEKEEVLKNIQKKNFYKPIGIMASIELANRAEKNGNYDQVIELLTPYVGHGENKLLRSFVYLKLGNALQEKKELSKAEELYQKAASDSKNLFKDWSQLRLASVLKALNRNEEAKKTLQELIQEGSKASEPAKDQAKSYLLFYFS